MLKNKTKIQNKAKILKKKKKKPQWLPKIQLLLRTFRVIVVRSVCWCVSHLPCNSRWAAACAFFFFFLFGKEVQNKHKDPCTWILSLCLYLLTFSVQSNSRDWVKKARGYSLPLAGATKLPGQECRSREMWRIGTNDAIYDIFDHMVVM